MTIPNPLLPSEEGELNFGVATITTQEEPEGEPYNLSFKYYNDDLCELDTGAVEPYGLSGLKAMKSLGCHIRAPGSPSMTYGVHTKHIDNSTNNEYRQLFTKLGTLADEGVEEMREAFLEGKRIEFDYKGLRGGQRPKRKDVPVNNGRIFFFPINSNKTLYIVAIRGTHLEVKKV